MDGECEGNDLAIHLIKSREDLEEKARYRERNNRVGQLCCPPGQMPTQEEDGKEKGQCQGQGVILKQVFVPVPKSVFCKEPSQ